MNSNDGMIKRSKPFKYTYEKEIVMYAIALFEWTAPCFFFYCIVSCRSFRYAYFQQLDYFSTECIYSPQAYRGYARVYLKDLEAIRPSSILDIIHSGEAFASNTPATGPTIGECERCGYMSSQRVCKACVLLEGLNRGLPRLGVGKTDVLVRFKFFT
jgi:cytoplasmic tRNA 2-thiolation protein 1